MARRVIEYIVADDNRDKGKHFVITEMSAAQAESWAMRALLLLMKNGVELPDGVERAGMAGVAEMGFKALSGISFAEVAPLLDEMLTCVKIRPDPTKAHIERPLIEEDTEEMTTRVKLRMQVWNLHTDFLRAAKR